MAKKKRPVRKKVAVAKDDTVRRDPRDANGSSADSNRASKQGYTFPKRSLEECVKLAQAIEEKNAGKPATAADLARMVGYNLASDWRFRDLLRAANMFGLVDGAGEAATVSLTEIGEDIVAPKDIAQRRQAFFRAFNSVQVFADVAKYYEGDKLPETEFFANTLVRDFEVPRERVELFIQVFTESVTYLRSFQTVKTKPAGYLEAKQSGQGEVLDAQDQTEPDESPAREFLDSCFVLMPFGGWYDRYFKEIYVPSIRAAGMEAIRADSLFQSGSVMDQIWSEIRKAKVLLAEVTGKNANVFYELGLAHACAKPVVLVTGSLDDVPFDLRHLRVVEYEVREPDWAQKVRAGITSHLKHAMDDPSKSLPSPFREIVPPSDDEADESEDIAGTSTLSAKS